MQLPDQIRFVQGNAVIATFGSILVVGCTVPVDSGIHIGVGFPGERSPAMLTLDKCGEYMLTTVSGVSEGFSRVVFTAPGFHNLLCLLKDLRGYDGPGGTLMVEVLFFGNVDLLAGQEIFNFIFMITAML